MGWLQLIALVRCAMEDGGLVVVSCCDGLGPIVYILMFILKLKDCETKKKWIVETELARALGRRRVARALGGRSRARPSP